MFGQHTFDSPRARSPWDPFLPTPPSDSSLEATKHLQNGIPKLVPEVEEGNIEYKLKLTNISAARFARLVTQLKWRLLEGFGQAYYELGVADSGALIGLARADLDESLETLEMMAGEIGASVIVVKEIEVPSSMVALADVATRYLDPLTGEWTGKMCKRMPAHTDDERASTTEPDTTDVTDSDEPPSSLSKPSTPADPPCAAPAPRYTTSYSHLSASNPTRPVAQASPSISPIDDDLALFSMEPEPAFSVDAIEVASDAEDADVDGDADASPFLVDLEIASVYKPRPVRTRVASGTSPLHALTYSSHGKRHKFKEKEKKHPSWRAQAQHDPALHAAAAGMVPNGTQEEKAAKRRLARDRRREERKKALLVGEPAMADEVVAVEEAVAVVEGDILTVAATEAIMALEADEDADLVAGLDALHVAMQDAVDAALEVEVKASELEPRLIVEALVVRKSSIEEAFLDFGGFSLL